jgi:sugar lactone lactonase YvrE
VGQIGEPDAVWLIDVDAPAHRRKVLSDAGHLNGFAFGPDGTLYAPLWQRDGIVAIDMQRGTEKLVATGVGMPAAVKVDRNGQLVSVDWLHGEIHRTDPKSGQTQILAIATPPLDNLALGPDGTVYVSNPADSTIQALAPDAQTMRDVVRGHFSAIAGLTMTTVNGREMLLVADPLAYRLVDPRTGEVIRPAYVQDIPMSTDIAANDRAVVTSHQSRGLVRMIARENGGIMGASIAEYKVPSATGVALLANGDIIAADFDDGQLVRLRDARTEIVARGLRGPMNLLPLSANEVLVSEATGGVVSKIDLRSGARTVIARDLDKPQGLALLPRGRLAIAEKGRGRVIAVSLKGSSKTEILADNLPVTADIFRALPDVGLPMGLAADRSGNIYVACVGDNSIRKIAAQR